MKFKSLALAVATLASAPAFADNVAYFTGASAIRANVAAAIKSLCTDAGGSLTIYKQGSSTSGLANQMAYVCSATMGGSAINTVFHTTTGGSLNSILGMSDDAAKQQVPVSLSSGCAAPVAGSGALAGYTVRANCAVGTAIASDGGFSDVEYQPVREQVDVLNAGVDGFSIDDVTTGFTGVAQVFGLAVSEKLYKDLQTAQGLVSAACPSGTATPSCQPSVNRADLVSLINNNEFNSAKLAGASVLGVAAGPIEYARRPTTSGTQSSLEIMALGKGCLTGPNFGSMQVIGDELATGASNAYGQLTVSVNSGTSDVTARLTAAGNSAYAFGWVSGENRAPATTTGWKFVKLNDAWFSEGTATGMNKQRAIDGKYDYFVETVSYKGPASKTDADEGMILDAIAGKMATTVADGGPATVGLFIIAENAAGYSHDTVPAEVSAFQRGGSNPNSCQPVARPF